MEEYIEIVRKSVNEVSKVFKQNPWFFYSEADIHARLYEELKKRLEERGKATVMDEEGNSIFLLFREFPTQDKYKKSGDNRRRGNFDLVILNPEDVIEKGLHTKRKKFHEYERAVAIEVKFDFTDARWEKEVDYCLDKLSEIDNKKGRFLLFFARRTRFKYFQGFKEFAETKDIQVKYIRVHPKKWEENFEEKWF